jgi:hypothetical protein
MSTFGKVSLASFGVLLFWEFVIGIEALTQGNIVGGLIGVGAFAAAAVALTSERFRAYLRRATNTKGHPARVIVVWAVAALVFTPRAVSLARSPLAFVNVHVTRSLIDAGVTAGLSLAALLTNLFVYFVFEKSERATEEQ